jgi:hypothetical protein
MWRQPTVAAVISCCLLTAAHAQAQLSNSVTGQAPASSPNGNFDSRSVNVYGTLNPQPPTGTTSQVVATPPPAALGTPTAMGFNLGGIVVDVGATEATYFDDNVFALPSNPLGDWAFVLRPELSWHSNNWSNAEVAGSAYVEGRKYATYDSEDQFNAGANVGGTVHIDSDTEVVGNAGYVHAHEDRGVSDTITDQFENPIAYDEGEAAAALNKRWNRVWASIGLAGLVVHYDNAVLDDGQIASQAYRSGDIERVPLRIGYVIAPLTSLFVEASGNRRDFDISSFSSHGYAVVGGILLEPGPGARIKGEAYAGYVNQNYNGASLQTISTWTVGGSLAYLATDQLTLTVEGRRDPREASLSGGVVLDDGVSVIESVGSARADYRILPNVAVGAGGSYIQDEYVAAERTDYAWSPLASIKYFYSPMVTFGFDYRYVNFRSTASYVPGYQRDVYMLSVNGRY